MPAAIPVTAPLLITVATAALLLVQFTVVAVVSLNCVTDPAHTVVVPNIADGFGCIVLGYII